MGKTGSNRVGVGTHPPIEIRHSSPDCPLFLLQQIEASLVCSWRSLTADRPEQDWKKVRSGGTSDAPLPAGKMERLSYGQERRWSRDRDCRRARGGLVVKDKRCRTAVKSSIWQIYIRQNHNQQHEKKHAEEDAEDRRFEFPPCHDLVLLPEFARNVNPPKGPSVAQRQAFERPACSGAETQWCSLSRSWSPWLWRQVQYSFCSSGGILRNSRPASR